MTKYIISTLLILMTLSALANSGANWVFARANACLNPDNINHVAANGECLALQTYTGKSQTLPHPNLLIFIHGDGIPGGGPSDYLKFQATKFTSPHTVAVVMIRPGYYDSYGHYSTGESHAFDCHGYPCDSYRPKTVATLVAAIKQLKKYHSPRCTILVGHSGGAIMSSIILGKYPNLASGAVLASVVGNIHNWAKKHGWGNYANSLSPNDWIKSIPSKSFVYIISGDNDKNTYPKMTKQFAKQLKNHGVKTTVFHVRNGTHNSVVLTNTKALDYAITRALQRCHTAK